jgi:hypothetical protein
VTIELGPAEASRTVTTVTDQGETLQILQIGGPWQSVAAEVAMAQRFPVFVNALHQSGEI